MAESSRKMDAKRKAILGTAILAVLIFLPLGWKLLYYQLTHATTKNAFVESDLINVSPLVSGHLKKILVDESDVLKKGQLLALIDEKDYLAQVELKISELNKVEMDISSLKTTLERTRREVEEEIVLARQGIMEVEEALKRTEANGKKIETDYKRFEKLIDRQAIAQSRFDAVEAQHTTSRASIRSAEIMVRIRKIQLKRALIGRQRVEEIEKQVLALNAARKTTQKALEVVELNMEHTRIKSPIAGVVAKKFVCEGDFISPGFPVFSIYDQNNIYIIANLEEVKMNGVRLGQRVDIKADAYPGIDFKGEVVRIGTASIAKFALIPRDTSAGEFTKVVQRIPIKISVEDTKRLLRPGFSVIINIELD